MKTIAAIGGIILMCGTANAGQPLDLVDHEARLAAYRRALEDCRAMHNKLTYHHENPTIHPDPNSANHKPIQIQKEVPYPDSPRVKTPNWRPHSECQPILDALSVEEQRR